jgi:hypothetical protein
MYILLHKHNTIWTKVDQMDLNSIVLCWQLSSLDT